MGLGLIFRWSENKISYLGVVYKYVKVGMEVTVVKEIFILYIYFLFLLIYCSFATFIYLFID